MSEQKYNLRKTMFILVPKRTFEKDQVITHQTFFVCLLMTVLVKSNLMIFLADDF